jgi:glutamine cyclotransferase
MVLRRYRRFAVALLAAPLASGQANVQAPQAAEAQSTRPVVYDAVAVARYPHDPKAFTQGLLWHESALFESTGRTGQSEIRKVDLPTGLVSARRALPKTHFGEGLALWGDELVSLTWQNGTIHRWRLDDLTPVRSDTDYPFEGWGLVQFRDALIASDGSSTLRVLDPENYSVRREIPVTLNNRPLPMLNELEAVDDLIFANVWMTNFIVAIDPRDGAVRRIIELTGLAEQVALDGDAVLNGIAWDPTSRRLFVTGKLWLYEIELTIRHDSR